MINSPINNIKNNPYKDFINVSNKKTPILASQATITIGDVKDTEPQKRNNKRIFGIIGLSVGSALLLTLVGLFTLSKGFSGNFAKKISNLSAKIKNTIYDLSNETKKLTLSQKLKLQLSKGLQPIADSLQASSNITAIKDSLFNKILKKFHLETIIKKTNVFFKNKIILKTKNQAYQKAELSTIEFCRFLEKMAEQNKNPELKEKAAQILENYTKTFSTSAHLKRADEAWQKMEGLDEKVYNALFKNDKGFWNNIKNLKSYITTDMIAKEKNITQKHLMSTKTNISNNLEDVYSTIKQSLKDLKIEIDPKNEKAVKLVKTITENLEASKKLNGAEEIALRKDLINKTKDHLRELNKIITNDPQNKHKLETINNKIQNLTNSLSDEMTKKGLVQEAITLLKNNPQEYKVAKKLANNLNTNLNKAISSEITTYEKLAELQVGSVPTDIIGILGPSALATGLIISSDTPNERISTTLTKGIPILGGIGVSYYGMTRGFTGVTNLILGLTTGSLLNIIGTKTNELYKKYADKQILLKKTFEAFTKSQAKTEQLPNNENVA